MKQIRKPNSVGEAVLETWDYLGAKRQKLLVELNRVNTEINDAYPIVRAVLNKRDGGGRKAA